MTVEALVAEAYRLQLAVEPIKTRLDEVRRQLADIQYEDRQPLLVTEVKIDGGSRWVSSTLIEAKDLLINPRKFYNRVSEKEFWRAVKVSVTEARMVMAEPDLLAISEEIPKTPYVKVATASKKVLAETIRGQKAVA